MINPVLNALRRGNIERDSPSSFDLYLGNGRMGARFDALGLNGSSHALRHASFWHRGKHGIDGWIAFVQVAWQQPPIAISEYVQSMDLPTGTLTTAYRHDSGWLEVKIRLHPGDLDSCWIEVSHQGDLPTIQISAPEWGEGAYDEPVPIQWETLDSHSATISVDGASCSVSMDCSSQQGSLTVKADRRGWLLNSAGSGKHLIRVSIDPKLNSPLPSIESLEKENADAWLKRYGTHFVSLDDTVQHSLWARLNYQLLASFAPDLRCPAPPCGWSGCKWPYTFPQDLAMVSPALLAMGHADIVKAWVEFWAVCLEENEANTLRIYGAEGAMWAWEHPIGPDFTLFPQEPPNWFGFEIHNSAYPARMAAECAAHCSKDWARTIAWPVILSSARFFASIAIQGRLGTEIVALPSMGQDEFGGINQRNYLCSLFAAESTWKLAVQFAKLYEIEDEALNEIKALAATPMAYGLLLDIDQGLLKTCESQSGEPFQFNRQKHPVQLNPLLFCPLNSRPDQFVCDAYSKRHQIVSRHKKGYHGWTLPAFILAGARIGNVQGLAQDLESLMTTDSVDPEVIQIYESSGLHDGGFYSTSAGLWLQALFISMSKPTNARPSIWQGEASVSLPPFGIPHHD